jgi:hypothetical protein
MALQTDDCDIRDVRFFMSAGDNGDFYASMIEYPKSKDKDLKVIHYRMSMSGGNAHRHPEVQRAFVNLYREMEKAGLNKHPRSEKQ